MNIGVLIPENGEEATLVYLSKTKEDETKKDIYENIIEVSVDKVVTPEKDDFPSDIGLVTFLLMTFIILFDDKATVTKTSKVSFKPDEYTIYPLNKYTKKIKENGKTRVLTVQDILKDCPQLAL